MGKHKHKRNRGREDILSRGQRKDKKDETEKILPIVQGLRSAKLSDRAVSISACAGFVDDDRLRKLLLQNNLIDTIMKNTLSDSSLELVSEGFGVLRSIMLAEPELSGDLIENHQLLIPINTTASKIIAQFSAGTENLSKTDRQILDSLIENLCGLGTSLTLAGIQDIDVILSKLVDLNQMAKIVVAQNTHVDSTVAALEYLFYASQSTDTGDVQLNQSIDSREAQVYITGIQCNQSREIPNILSEILKPIEGLANEALANATQTEEGDEDQDVKTEALSVALEILSDAIPKTQHQVESLTQIIQLLVKIAELPYLSTPALTALNNIAWALNSSGQNWGEYAQGLADPVSKMLLANSIGESAEPAIGLIGALAAQLKYNQSLEAAIETCLKDVLDGFNVSEEYLTALAAAVGYVGKTPKLLEPSAKFIIDILESGPPDVIVDALYALFELFGGDEPEIASFYELNNIQDMLESLHDRITESLDASNGRQSEALQNFQNFLVYKKTSQ